MTDSGAPQSEQPQGGTSSQPDSLKIHEFVQRLRDNQNLGLGLVGGIVGGLIGAILWAVISAITNYEIGFMAIGVGFLVGFGVRTLGKGVDTIYGVVGAILSLVSCAFGEFLAAVAIIAKDQHVDIIFAFFRLLPHAFDILSSTFNFYDVLFAGIALYFGYRYSFRRITEGELAGLR